MKKIFILLIATILVGLLLQYYTSCHEDVIHLKGDEFKKKPETSIESTILHREREVYDHILLIK
ncbi:MAG TPA: hypothetical protein DEQ74_02425 [Wolbachia sp.]|nr:hypothetical protein [Wolbachia sp.]